MNKYKHYKGDEVTKEILDSVKVDDLIKINNWGKPFRVKGVSKDYFLMTCNIFGETHYSVCEKKRYKGIKHNKMTKGKFHCGTDHWIFGSDVWQDWEDKSFKENNKEAVKEYLETFELKEGDIKKSKLSHRTSVPIDEVYIKSK